MFGNVGAIRAMSQAARLQEAGGCEAVETALDGFEKLVGETIRELGEERARHLAI